MTKHFKRFSGRAQIALHLFLPALLLASLSALPAHAQDLQNDDLLVGASIDGPALSGVVWRLRGAALDKFCDSSVRSFYVPEGVMVDSQGRVVFLASIPSPNIQFPHRGLFRCNALAAVPDLLAVIPGIGDVNPGDPNPFPGQHFNMVSGLHLARLVAGTIDDQVNGGTPQLGGEDVYVLVVGQFDPTTGQLVGIRTVRYHTATQLWDDGRTLCTGADCRGYAPVDAINHAGVTYFIRGGQYLRRAKDPLSLDISGTLPDSSTFRLTASLFGGSREIGAFILDYVNLGHTPSGCPPDPQINPDMPIPPDGGAFWVTDGFRSVVFDEWGDLGIVIATGSIAAGFPYQANVSEALLDKPGDLSQYFQDNFIGCQAVPAFKSRFIMPFSGPAGSNIVENLVSAPSGIAGTNPFGPLVARLAPGSDRLQVLADRSMFSNLYYPLSLGAFPATASVGGVVIMLRVDSHANVVVTGPDGRRIGVDPASGSPLNDFDDDGFDSGPGIPRFFALRNAAPGSYAVQNVATADGPFAVHVYSADPAQTMGNHIVATGVAAVGDINNHDFTLDLTGSIGFLGPAVAAGSSTANATPTPWR